MDEDRNLDATRLMTEVRIAADERLIPVWPPLGASAAKRVILDDGIRYLLVLPRIELQIEILATTLPVPTVSLTLSARPAGILRRAGATFVRPFDAGFERIASELITEPSADAVERALHRCRTALWDHPSFGHDAVGLRRVA